MQKAKIVAEENKNKPEEIGGIKFAPLEKPVAARVDVNEPLISTRTPAQTFTGNPQISFGLNVNPPQYTNSGTGSFKPLEKTPQQLKEEELEKKMAMNYKPSKDAGWLGKKSETKPEAPQEHKISAWAQRGNETSEVAPVKFAALEKSTQ
jgi:hypothetical protein